MKAFLPLIVLLASFINIEYSYAGKENEFEYVSDSLPYGKLQIPKQLQKDSIKTGFLKKIAKALRFRRNFQEKQKAFILKTIADLNLNDTIIANSDRLKQLIVTVDEKENVRYNTLLLLIDSIKTEINKKVFVDSKDIPVKDNLSEDLQLNPEETIEDEPPYTPVFIEEEEKNDKQKRETLSLIKQLIATPGKEMSRIAGNGSSRLFSYKLHKKAEICGFYNGLSGFNVNNFAFSLLSTLVYDSLLAVNKDGNLVKLITWEDTKVIDAAKKAGCNIIFSIVPTSKTDLAMLLNSGNAQQNFIQKVQSLQNNNMADGISVNFLQLNETERSLFTKFILNLSRQLKKSNSRFKIYVSVPAFDQSNAYNIKAMDPVVDRFCINFSLNQYKRSLPLAPLKGKEANSMTTSLSYYLNQQVAPDKFIANLPYRGTKWIMDSTKRRLDIFLQYVSYSTIRNKTFSETLYDEKSTSAYIDTTYTTKNIKTRIWFDDENTLAPKYDFVLANGLGGIGFSYLGYDGVYGELLDILAYKFIEVDSVAINETKELSFWQKLHRRFTLYRYILENPCETCFISALDNRTWDSLPIYLKELKIDSIVSAKNKIIKAHNLGKEEKDVEPPLTAFLYVTKELNNLFLYISLFFLILISITSIIYIHLNRTIGSYWEYKKATTWLLVGLSVLCLWSVFNFLFTTDLIPFFGVTTTYNSDINNNIYSSKEDEPLNCLPIKDCVNIPLQTLEAIIVVALLIGILLARYLILPLLRKEDIP